MMVLLMAILAIGAAIATFVENDFGASSAKVLVYNSIWYEVVLALTCINMAGIIYKTKMWKKIPKFIFHASFIVIALGALITRYAGYEGILHVRQGAVQNKMISAEPYLILNVEYKNKTYKKLYPLELSALGNNFNYNFAFADKKLKISYVDYIFTKKGQANMGLLTVKLKMDKDKSLLRLVGKRGMQGRPASKILDGAKISLSYGSKVITLPFSIKLKKFELTRYPGSMAPSSYASQVSVIEKNKTYDYRIFMNHTLEVGHYLLFQSSYDMDEKGTILSVNNDPGKWPTYLGYFMLTLGLLLNLFDRRSRFRILSKNLKNLAPLAILGLMIFGSVNLKAASTSDSLMYFNNLQTKSLKTADDFGHLITQGMMGRMMPLDTLDREVVNKITQKSTMFGLNSNQIVLGMLTRPDIWRSVKMIKITSPKLKKIIGIKAKENFISFDEVFKNNTYMLMKYVNQVQRDNPSKRGTFGRDVLKVNERINVAYMVFSGNMLKIFPKAVEFAGQKNTDKWFSPIEAMNHFSGMNGQAISIMVRGLIGSAMNEKWKDADTFIGHIKTYQAKVGAKLLPKESSVNAEIFFNKLNIFVKLTVIYVILGLILLIIAFSSVFSKKFHSKKLHKFFEYLVILLFIVHTLGMIGRWYISGHAPWSNAYESMLYISWASMLAGVAFFRKYLLALSATVVMAGVFMFTAYLNHMDPQITNLVPVLKSYWLTIHVSVLAGSYGFLGLGAILGMMTLILFIFRNPNNKSIDKTITHLATINEIALILGLSALAIGNFLGAIWANESWGRYWGWDPKETWAYISIIAYTIVLHLRLIKTFNTAYVFSVASVIAFACILMTYFGVNFYLSGLHSYATGDPVPIPVWVYILGVVVLALIVLAYKNRNLKKHEGVKK